MLFKSSASYKQPPTQIKGQVYFNWQIPQVEAHTDSHLHPTSLCPWDPCQVEQTVSAQNWYQYKCQAAFQPHHYIGPFSPTPRLKCTQIMGIMNQSHQHTIQGVAFQTSRKWREIVPAHNLVDKLSKPQLQIELARDIHPYIPITSILDSTPKMCCKIPFLRVDWEQRHERTCKAPSKDHIHMIQFTQNTIALVLL